MNQLPTRKPNRLRGYDYSTNGAYFVTICSKDRARIFGTITVGDGLAHPAHPVHPADAITVQLSEYGRIAETELQNIPTYYNGCVTVDCFVVMPNHIHAIIIITGGMSGDETGRGITTTGRDTRGIWRDATSRDGQARPLRWVILLVGINRGCRADVVSRCGNVRIMTTSSATKRITGGLLPILKITPPDGRKTGFMGNDEHVTGEPHTVWDGLAHPAKRSFCGG